MQIQTLNIIKLIAALELNRIKYEKAYKHVRQYYYNKSEPDRHIMPVEYDDLIALIKGGLENKYSPTYIWNIAYVFNIDCNRKEFDKSKTYSVGEIILKFINILESNIKYAIIYNHINECFAYDDYDVPESYEELIDILLGRVLNNFIVPFEVIKDLAYTLDINLDAN